MLRRWRVGVRKPAFGRGYVPAMGRAGVTALDLTRASQAQPSFEIVPVRTAVRQGGTQARPYDGLRVSIGLDDPR